MGTGEYHFWQCHTHETHSDLSLSIDCLQSFAQKKKNKTIQFKSIMK